MPCGMIFSANNLLMMHRIPHTDCRFVNNTYFKFSHNTFDYYLSIYLNFSLMSLVSFGAVNES